MITAVPYVVLAVIAVVAFGVWALHQQATAARSRAGLHCCLGCGYDLRGSTDRCPECGRDAPRGLDRAKLRRPPDIAERMTAGPLADPLDAVVHETPDREEAHLVVWQLQLRGIPAARTDDPFPGQPFLVLFRVWVGTADVRRATAALQWFEPAGVTTNAV